MELIDFSRNENSIKKYSHVESVLLYGNPNIQTRAQITICIPTYNRPILLRRAINSAFNQITDISYIIIVVDNDPDFNNMEILDIIKSFNRDNLLYYKNKENLMLFGNLNRCGYLANTQYFSLLHDDDLLLPNYISSISQYICHGKIDVLCVNSEQINNQFVSPRKGYHKFLKKIIKLVFIHSEFNRIPLFTNMFLGDVYGPPTCGMVFKRRSFLKSGGFNQEYWPSADWIFMIFFSRYYKVMHLKKSLGHYIWGHNVSLQRETLEKTTFQRKQILKSLIEQNRFCKIIFILFCKDFIKKMDSPIESSPKYSFFYNFLVRICSLLWI